MKKIKIKNYIKNIYKGINFINRFFYRYIIVEFKKQLLESCGRKVFIGKRSIITYFNVNIGNDVFIGPNAIFLSTKAKIFINDHVMFGPQVTMITGDHRFDVIGKYITEISDDEKKPENDKDIIIEGDNWIGSNATILKGVRIGKGSIIAANSLVNRDVPKYSIYGGNPAKLIRERFSKQEIIDHEKKIQDSVYNKDEF